MFSNILVDYLNALFKILFLVIVHKLFSDVTILSEP